MVMIVIKLVTIAVLLLSPGIAMHLPAGEYTEKPDLPDPLDPTRLTCLGGQQYRTIRGDFKHTGESCSVNSFKRRFR